MKVNASVMALEARKGFTNPQIWRITWPKRRTFPGSHAIVGRLVLKCSQKNCALEDLTLDELKKASPVFEQDIYERFLWRTVLNQEIFPGDRPLRLYGKQSGPPERNCRFLKKTGKHNL